MSVNISDYLTNSNGSIRYYVGNITEEGRTKYDIVMKFFTVTDFFLLLIGLIGNIIVCAVRKWNASMRTPASYYIISLAISDLLLLITVTVKDRFSWLDVNFDKVLRALTQFSMNMSILTTTAYAAARYVAICHPFYHYKTSDLRLAMKIIISLWIFILITCIPGGAIQIFWPSNTPEIMDELAKIMLSFLFMNFVVFHLLPVIGMAILYLMIGWEILKSCSTGPMNLNANDAADPTRRLFIMFIIVCVSFVCYEPTYVTDYITLNIWLNRNFLTMDPFVYFCFDLYSRLLLRVYTCFNPMIYSATSPEFRRAFMETTGMAIDRLRNSRLFKRPTE